jgi:GH25 family lysozyme M1 (1,4-beta-N-acetylmuramidase)
MYTVKGVDVSIYQSSQDGIKRMDWSKAKQFIQFAYLKSSTGAAGKDREFDYNYSECNRLDIVWGAYHFFKGDKDPIKQAQWWAGVIGYWDDGFNFEPDHYHYYGTLEPMLDLEKGSKPLLMMKNEFGNRLEKFHKQFVLITGIEFGIYTNAWLDTNAPLSTWMWRLPLWSASWRSVVAYVPLEWRNHGRAAKWHQHAVKKVAFEYGSGGEDDIDLDGYVGTINQFNTEYGTNILPLEEGEEYMKMRCLTNTLNVRKNSSTTATIVEQLHLGYIIEKLEEKQVGNDTWIRIGFNQWCAKVHQGDTYLEEI